MDEEQEHGVWLDVDRTASRDELCDRYGRSVGALVHDHYSMHDRIWSGLDDAKQGVLGDLLLMQFGQPLGTKIYADELVDKRGETKATCEPST
jgi:hypothetical protein